MKQGRFTSEASVSQGIVLPVLNSLGWPVFDTSIVTPEYSVEGRRVDFALCHPANKPAVFVEVKKVGFTDGADKQLFEYAFHLGSPWQFLLMAKSGISICLVNKVYTTKARVYKFDLLERDAKSATDRLERYLTYKRSTTGEALKAARLDYQNVTRDRDIDSTLPKAWRALIEEQDSLLLDLLAEKVEDICGFKPNPDICSQFIDTNGDQYNYLYSGY